MACCDLPGSQLWGLIVAGSKLRAQPWMEAAQGEQLT